MIIPTVEVARLAAANRKIAEATTLVVKRLVNDDVLNPAILPDLKAILFAIAEIETVLEAVTIENSEERCNSLV